MKAFDYFPSPRLDFYNYVNTYTELLIARTTELCVHQKKTIQMRPIEKMKSKKICIFNNYQPKNPEDNK